MFGSAHWLPLDQQVIALQEILNTNLELTSVLKIGRELGFPNWYVGAGAIAQTVWNYFHGFAPLEGIKDYDFVYFDSDISYEAEDRCIQKGLTAFQNISRPVEIRNQARVHLWYKDHFGYDIPPHACTEHAITTWPATATAIGIRLEADDILTVYAPYGLHDLLGMVVRPNKVKITEQIYLDKVHRWQAAWPKLKIMPW
ncbi:MAG: nucleotidyltransferase family protein [Candidatus Abawacabacteria bacterium]|nr:nucleotidyltransferase family protein [Candidatus Abawacabacteria bacterium]